MKSISLSHKSLLGSRLVWTGVLRTRTAYFVVAMTLAAVTLAGANEEGRLTSERNERAVLKYLRPELKASKRCGRLNYMADCSGKDGYPLPFPKISAQSAEPGKSGLAAVRSIFRSNDQISIRRNHSGIIEISFGNPPTSLLQTRVHSVMLEPLAQYNPIMVIGAIGDTSEFRAAMKREGFEFPLTVTDMYLVTPEKGRPHLPAKLEDITVGQVLDLIAETFRGVATYAVCGEAGGKRLVSMDFLFLENRVDIDGER
jgi:hypothetical protein